MTTNIDKMIFVSGPSESGKSYGAEFIGLTYPSIKRLKIRDIFASAHKRISPNTPYLEWYESLRQSDLGKLWGEYIYEAEQMAPNARHLIMDTMYGVASLQTLYNQLGSRLKLLYIDAPFSRRVSYEFERLRTAQEPGKDLTMDMVEQRTAQKDREKGEREMFLCPQLSVGVDGKLNVSNSGKRFAYIINNDQDISTYQNELRAFVERVVIS